MQNILPVEIVFRRDTRELEAFCEAYNAWLTHARNGSKRIGWLLSDYSALLNEHLCLPTKITVGEESLLGNWEPLPALVIANLFDWCITQLATKTSAEVYVIGDLSIRVSASGPDDLELAPAGSNRSLLAPREGVLAASDEFRVKLREYIAERCSATSGGGLIERMISEPIEDETEHIRWVKSLRNATG